MKAAAYALIRYIGDPVRNEALNVGIVAWDDHEYRFGFDAGATKRVVQSNPHLAVDALSQVESHLRHQFDSLPHFEPEALRAIISRENRFPLEFTEPRLTTLANDQLGGVHAAFDRLMGTLVQPRRRTRQSKSRSLTLLARYFQPLIKQQRMQQNHVFGASKTGIHRQVDFYANSGVNLVLDTLQLTFRTPERIMEAADSEAFKIEDITARNHIEYWVYCDFAPGEALSQATEDARRSIESSGAKIMPDLRQTAKAIIERVGAH